MRQNPMIPLFQLRGWVELVAVLIIVEETFQHVESRCKSDGVHISSLYKTCTDKKLWLS